MGIEDRDWHKQKEKDIEESNRVRICPICQGLSVHLTHSDSPSSYEGDVFSCSYCGRRYHIINGRLVEF